MTEKIGLVKNPLTIIAIFAGIAEVSGTVILPFITDDNQAVFVWFLMVFPILLISLFFWTLNKNSKVLYAPSDFQNEDNYLQMHHYDKAKREEVLINVSKDDQVKAILGQVGQLESRIDSLIATLNNKEAVPNDQSKDDDTPIVVNDLADEASYDIFITDTLRPLASFLVDMKVRGYKCAIDNTSRYASASGHSQNDYAAIWLGYGVPFKVAKEVVLTAKKHYPHLKYILIDGDKAANSFAFPAEEKQIFIGGATETAKEYGLTPLTSADFTKLAKANERETFYDIIRARYPKA